MSRKRKASTDINPTTNHSRAILSCVQKMYLDEETADVHFVFDSGNGMIERVPTHKNILGCRSEVFKAMFFGEMKEEGDIRMVDVSAAAFKEFLQFFYLSEAELSTENIHDVMNMGKMYEIPQCLTECDECLQASMTDDDLCRVYSLAILFDREALKRFCEKRIVAASKAVFESTGFLECDKRVLSHILELNLLSYSELEVFEACITWVRAAAKTDKLTPDVFKTYFGDLVHKIRFGSMSIEEFGRFNEIFGYLFEPDEYEEMEESNTSNSNKFNMNIREIKWNKEAAIECNRTVENSETRYCFIKNINVTTFTSNEPILFGEFVYSKIKVLRDGKYMKPTSDSSVEVAIIEHSEITNYEQPDVKILFNINVWIKAKNETAISLSKPVLIRPGYFYTIQSKFAQGGHVFKCTFTESLGAKEQVELDPETIIRFYNDRTLKKDSKICVNAIKAIKFNRLYV